MMDNITCPICQHLLVKPCECINCLCKQTTGSPIDRLTNIVLLLGATSAQNVSPMQNVAPPNTPSKTPIPIAPSASTIPDTPIKYKKSKEPKSVSSKSKKKDSETKQPSKKSVKFGSANIRKSIRKAVGTLSSKFAKTEVKDLEPILVDDKEEDILDKITLFTIVECNERLSSRRKTRKEEYRLFNREMAREYCQGSMKKYNSLKKANNLRGEDMSETRARLKMIGDDKIKAIASQIAKDNSPKEHVCSWGSPARAKGISSYIIAPDVRHPGPEYYNVEIDNNHVTIPYLNCCYKSDSQDKFYEISLLSNTCVIPPSVDLLCNIKNGVYYNPPPCLQLYTHFYMRKEITNVVGDGNCGAHALFVMMKRYLPSLKYTEVLDECRVVSMKNNWFDTAELAITAAHFGFSMCVYSADRVAQGKLQITHPLVNTRLVYPDLQHICLVNQRNVHFYAVTDMHDPECEPNVIGKAGIVSIDIDWKDDVKTVLRDLKKNLTGNDDDLECSCEPKAPGSSPDGGLVTDSTQSSHSTLSMVDTTPMIDDDKVTGLVSSEIATVKKAEDPVPIAKFWDTLDSDMNVNWAELVEQELKDIQDDWKTAYSHGVFVKKDDPEVLSKGLDKLWLAVQCHLEKEVIDLDDLINYLYTYKYYISKLPCMSTVETINSTIKTHVSNWVALLHDVASHCITFDIKNQIGLPLLVATDANMLQTFGVASKQTPDIAFVAEIGSVKAPIVIEYTNQVFGDAYKQKMEKYEKLIKTIKESWGECHYFVIDIKLKEMDACQQAFKKLKPIYDVLNLNINKGYILKFLNRISYVSRFVFTDSFNYNVKMLFSDATPTRKLKPPRESRFVRYVRRSTKYILDNIPETHSMPWKIVDDENMSLWEDDYEEFSCKFLNASDQCMIIDESFLGKALDMINTMYKSLERADWYCLFHMFAEVQELLEFASQQVLDGNVDDRALLSKVMYMISRYYKIRHDIAGGIFTFSYVYDKQTSIKLGTDADLSKFLPEAKSTPDYLFEYINPDTKKIRLLVGEVSVSGSLDKALTQKGATIAMSKYKEELIALQSDPKIELVLWCPMVVGVTSMEDNLTSVMSCIDRLTGETYDKDRPIELMQNYKTIVGQPRFIGNLATFVMSKEVILPEKMYEDAMKLINMVHKCYGIKKSSRADDVSVVEIDRECKEYIDVNMTVLLNDLKLYTNNPKVEVDSKITLTIDVGKKIHYYRTDEERGIRLNRFILFFEDNSICDIVNGCIKKKGNKFMHASESKDRVPIIVQGTGVSRWVPNFKGPHKPHSVSSATAPVPSLFGAAAMFANSTNYTLANNMSMTEFTDRLVRAEKLLADKKMLGDYKLDNDQVDNAISKFSESLEKANLTKMVIDRPKRPFTLPVVDMNHAFQVKDDVFDSNCLDLVIGFMPKGTAVILKKLKNNEYSNHKDFQIPDGLSSIKAAAKIKLFHERTVFKKNWPDKTVKINDKFILKHQPEFQVVLDAYYRAEREVVRYIKSADAKYNNLKVIKLTKSDDREVSREYKNWRMSHTHNQSIKILEQTSCFEESSKGYENIIEDVLGWLMSTCNSKTISEGEKTVKSLKDCFVVDNDTAGCLVYKKEMFSAYEKIISQFGHINAFHLAEFLGRFSKDLLYFSQTTCNQNFYHTSNLGRCGVTLIVRGGKKIFDTTNSRHYRLIYPIPEVIVKYSTPNVSRENSSDSIIRDPVTGITYYVTGWSVLSERVLHQSVGILYQMSTYFLSMLNRNQLETSGGHMRQVLYPFLLYLHNRRTTEKTLHGVRYILCNSMAKFSSIESILPTMAIRCNDVFQWALMRKIQNRYPEYVKAVMGKEGSELDAVILHGDVPHPFIESENIHSINMLSNTIYQTFMMTKAPYIQSMEQSQDIIGVLEKHEYYVKEVNATNFEEWFTKTDIGDRLGDLFSNKFNYDGRALELAGRICGSMLRQNGLIPKFSGWLLNELNSNVEDYASSSGLRGLEKSDFRGKKGHEIAAKKHLLYAKEVLLKKGKSNMKEVFQEYFESDRHHTKIKEEVIKENKTKAAAIEEIGPCDLKFHLVDKIQRGGGREIYVCNVNTRIQQKILEEGQRRISEGLPGELIHISSDERSSLIHSKLFEKTPIQEVDIKTAYLSFDCSGWAANSNLNKFVMFAIGLSSYLPSYYIMLLLSFFNRMYNKKVYFSPKAVTIIKSNQRYHRLHEYIKYDDALDCSYMDMPYSFMMGIFNFFSSNIHRVNQVMCSASLSSGRLDVESVDLQMMAHSDDSAGRLIYRKVSEVPKVLRYYEIGLKMFNHMLSEKKCSVSASYFELLSILYINKTLVPMAAKFLAQVMFHPNGGGFTVDMCEYYSTIVELVKNGATMQEAYLAGRFKTLNICNFYKLPWDNSKPLQCMGSPDALPMFVMLCKTWSDNLRLIKIDKQRFYNFMKAAVILGAKIDLETGTGCFSPKMRRYASDTVRSMIEDMNANFGEAYEYINEKTSGLGANISTPFTIFKGVELLSKLGTISFVESLSGMGSVRSLSRTIYLAAAGVIDTNLGSLSYKRIVEMIDKIVICLQTGLDTLADDLGKTILEWNNKDGVTVQEMDHKLLCLDKMSNYAMNEGITLYQIIDHIFNDVNIDIIKHDYSCKPSLIDTASDDILLGIKTPADALVLLMRNPQCRWMVDSVHADRDVRAFERYLARIGVDPATTGNELLVMLARKLRSESTINMRIYSYTRSDNRTIATMPELVDLLETSSIYKMRIKGLRTANLPAESVHRYSSSIGALACFEMDWLKIYQSMLKAGYSLYINTDRHAVFKDQGKLLTKCIPDKLELGGTQFSRLVIKSCKEISSLNSQSRRINKEWEANSVKCKVFESIIETLKGIYPGMSVPQLEYQAQAKFENQRYNDIKNSLQVSAEMATVDTFYFWVKSANQYLEQWFGESTLYLQIAEQKMQLTFIDGDLKEVKIPYNHSIHRFSKPHSDMIRLLVTLSGRIIMSPARDTPNVVLGVNNNGYFAIMPESDCERCFPNTITVKKLEGDEILERSVFRYSTSKFGSVNIMDNTGATRTIQTVLDGYKLDLNQARAYIDFNDAENKKTLSEKAYSSNEFHQLFRLTEGQSLKVDAFKMIDQFCGTALYDVVISEMLQVWVNEPDKLKDPQFLRSMFKKHAGKLKYKEPSLEDCIENNLSKYAISDLPPETKESLLQYCSTVDNREPIKRQLLDVLLSKGDSESKAYKITEIASKIKIGNVASTSTLVDSNEVVNAHILKNTFYYINNNTDGSLFVKSARHLIRACYSCLSKTRMASHFTKSSTTAITMRRVSEVDCLNVLFNRALVTNLQFIDPNSAPSLSVASILDMMEGYLSNPSNMECFKSEIRSDPLLRTVPINLFLIKDWLYLISGYFKMIGGIMDQERAVHDRVNIARGKQCTFAFKTRSAGLGSDSETRYPWIEPNNIIKEIGPIVGFGATASMLMLKPIIFRRRNIEVKHVIVEGTCLNNNDYLDNIPIIPYEMLPCCIPEQYRDQPGIFADVYEISEAVDYRYDHVALINSEFDSLIEDFVTTHCYAGENKRETAMYKLNKDSVSSNKSLYSNKFDFYKKEIRYAFYNLVGVKDYRSYYKMFAHHNNMVLLMDALPPTLFASHRNIYYFDVEDKVERIYNKTAILVVVSSEKINPKMFTESYGWRYIPTKQMLARMKEHRIIRSNSIRVDGEVCDWGPMTWACNSVGSHSHAKLAENKITGDDKEGPIESITDELIRESPELESIITEPNPKKSCQDLLRWLLKYKINSWDHIIRHNKTYIWVINIMPSNLRKIIGSSANIPNSCYNTFRNLIEDILRESCIEKGKVDFSEILRTMLGGAEGIMQEFLAMLAVDMAPKAMVRSASIDSMVDNLSSYNIRYNPFPYGSRVAAELSSIMGLAAVPMIMGSSRITTFQHRRIVKLMNEISCAFAFGVDHKNINSYKSYFKFIRYCITNTLITDEIINQSEHDASVMGWKNVEAALRYITTQICSVDYLAPIDMRPIQLFNEKPPVSEYNAEADYLSVE